MKILLIMVYILASGIYSGANAQTYSATVSQQQAINNASKVESLANIVKAMNQKLNDKLTIIETIQTRTRDCSASGKIYNKDTDTCVVTIPNMSVSFLDSTAVCGQYNWTDIAGASTADTFCALTAADQDAFQNSSGYQCQVKRTASGKWQTKFPVSCGAINCIATCVKISFTQ